MKIEITTAHAASSYGVPVCLINGQLVDDKDGLKSCLEQLGWSRSELAKRTNKSLDAINSYGCGRLPVPANVWLVLRDQLSS